MFHYILDIQLTLVCSQLENHDPFIQPIADVDDSIYLDLILSNISLISSLFIHLEKDLILLSDRMLRLNSRLTHGVRVISKRKESTCTFSSITDTQFRMCSSLTWWNNQYNGRCFLGTMHILYSFVPALFSIQGIFVWDRHLAPEGIYCRLRSPKRWSLQKFLLATLEQLFTFMEAVGVLTLRA